MRIIFILFLLTSFANTFSSEWRLVKEKNNIKIYSKSDEDSSLVSFRGVGEVNAPFGKVVQIVLDPNRARTWGKDLKESKVLKWIKKPLEFVEYNEVNMPLFIQNRDFVSKIKITVNKKEKYIRVDYVKDHDYENPVKEDNILGDLTGSYFIVHSIDGGRRALLDGVAIADPKGWIPGWVVNLFQSNWPYGTITKIRLQAERNDIKSHPYFSKVFR